jgi:hypothetical protein
LSSSSHGLIEGAMVPKIVPNFWGCVEVDAISRDFDYSNYKYWHSLTQCKGALLCEEAYCLLQEAFHIQMEQDIEHNPDAG